MYPCDEHENDRMDIYHRFFAVARRGQLHQSPHANVKLPETVVASVECYNMASFLGRHTNMSSYTTDLDDFMGGREFDGHLAVSPSASAPTDSAPLEPQVGKKRKAEKEPEVSSVSSV